MPDGFVNAGEIPSITTKEQTLARNPSAETLSCNSGGMQPTKGKIQIDFGRSFRRLQVALDRVQRGRPARGF
jgi:hypothetical protein